MIKSKYILSILDLLLDGDESENVAKRQLEFLEDIEYNYTGMGLFVTFSHSDNARNFILQKENTVLNGVKIISNDLENGAYTFLHFKNGVIDNLEILANCGDYPKKELTNYALTQEWKGTNGRQICSE